MITDAKVGELVWFWDGYAAHAGTIRHVFPVGFAGYNVAHVVLDVDHVVDHMLHIVPMERTFRTWKEVVRPKS